MPFRPGFALQSTFATHTHPLGAATTTADALQSVGAPANVTADDVGVVAVNADAVVMTGALVQSGDIMRQPGAIVLNNCAAVGCDAASLDGAGVVKATAPTGVGWAKLPLVSDVPVTARADLVQASGVSKVAAVVTAIPANTGAPN